MAKKLYLHDIDLAQNQLINAVLESRTTAPENPVAGQRYYDSEAGVDKIFDGTSWNPVATSGDINTLSDRVDTLENTVAQNEIEAADTSVEVTPNASGVKTKVGVKLQSTNNDIQVGASGIYSTPYAGDNSTVEISNKVISVKSGVFDANGAADTAEQNAKDYTDTQIAGLDVATLSDAGKYVATVTETDGKVSATFKQVEASEVSVADANNHFTGTDVESVLDELYEQAGEGSAITITEVTSGLGDSVLKAYKIYQGGTAEGNLKGTINIPKDLVVTSGSVVTGTWDGSTFTEDATQPGTGTGKALKLVIANQQAPVYINVLDLVKDHTAGNGIAISNANEISLVLDPTTEGFLTLSANGLKLSGVQTAIDTAEQNAKDYADGLKTAIDAYTINSKAISTNPVLDGSDIALTGYTKASTANQAIAATDTVNQAIGKLEAELDENEEVTARALVDLDDRVSTLEDDDSSIKARLDVIEGSGAGSIAKGDADTLSAANDYTDQAVQDAVGSGVHAYNATFTSGNTGTIQATVHKCGTIPMVKAYLNGAEVEVATTIDSTGNVTVSWNGNVVSASTPLVIKVIG